MQGAGNGDNVLCPTLFCGVIEKIARLFVRRSGRIGRSQVAVDIMHLNQIVIPRWRSKSFKLMGRVINPSSMGLSHVVVVVYDEDEDEAEGGVKRNCSVTVSCLTVPD